MRNNWLRNMALVALLLAPAPASAELRAHFIDVGQGDAILLEKQQGAVLIDAGNPNGLARDYLEENGIGALDLFVGTHAHADHIGGFPAILEAIPVAEVWYNGQEHTTLTFERFLDAVLSSEAGYHEPERGDTWTLGRLAVTVLHPESSAADYEGALHDKSIVLRVDYADVSFLLTGDAEHGVELDLIDAGAPLKADILKLGHHGSRTSTHSAFAAAVDPALAVYQAGAGNRYGHPHAEVLARLQDLGAEVRGTDLHGTLIVWTDGSAWRVEHELDPDIARVAEEPLQAECLDLNNVTKDRLREIVHLGPARARAVVSGRPWRRVSDLTRLHGIGEARLADIADQGLACVNP